jgi:hypothetical protein
VARDQDSRGSSRHSTPVRRIRSAWLFVGTTPSIVVNNQSDGQIDCRLRQNLAVFRSAQQRPSSKISWNSRAIGSTRTWRLLRSISPAREGN